MPITATVTGLGELLHSSPLLATATLFGAGILTSLTPCIYPMIPITAALIAGTATDRGAGLMAGDPPGSAVTTDEPSDAATPGGLQVTAATTVTRSPARGRVLRLTLTYVTGFALLYALLGLLAGMTGSLFGTVASSAWARLVTGALLLVFGLAMLGVFPVPIPQRITTWAAGRAGGSYPAVFVLGASSGLVAAPCGAPAFAAVLTWVATTGSALLGFTYLFAFSLGMSTLLIAVGLFAGTAARLPRSGPWMLRVQRAGGVLLIIMAFYYFVQMSRVL